MPQDRIKNPAALLKVLRTISRARLELLLDEDGRLLVTMTRDPRDELVIRRFGSRLEKVSEVDVLEKAESDSSRIAIGECEHDAPLELGHPRRWTSDS